MDNKSELVIYTTEDGLTKVDVTFENETVWLTQEQMAELFQRDKSTISRHINNIFCEGELDKSSTVANFATVQTEGNRAVERQIEYYNHLVSGYFDIAEINAIEHKPMYMSDYIRQLDAVLTSGDRKLLDGAGNVSHKQALEKAKAEYKRYQQETVTPVEKAYLESIKATEKTAKKKVRESK